MKPPKYLIFTLTAAALLGTGPSGTAADKDGNDAVDNKIDPQAIAILNRAVDRLAGAKQFSVTAEIWADTELEEGGRAQFTKTVDVKVRRPNKVQADVRTSVPKRSFYYDGKNFALLDQQKGFYGIDCRAGHDRRDPGKNGGRVWCLLPDQRPHHQPALW